MFCYWSVKHWLLTGVQHVVPKTWFYLSWSAEVLHLGGGGGGVIKVDLKIWHIWHRYQIWSPSCRNWAKKLVISNLTDLKLTPFGPSHGRSCIPAGTDSVMASLQLSLLPRLVQNPFRNHFTVFAFANAIHLNKYTYMHSHGSHFWQ